jgi:DNA adenine methylase
MVFSPLRYPGGKAKLAGYVKAILSENDLDVTEYCEPYAGGAAIALDLLENRYVSRIRLNDLNPHVYAFWSAVLNDTDALNQKISSTALTIDVWRRQREIYRRPEEHSLLENAFAFFFLNRTNRSGILNAGVIGGLSQRGEWKIDARFPKEELIRRITAVADKRHSIRVSSVDAVRFISKYFKTSKASSFIYLDPPYFAKGADLYDNFYDESDHASVAEIVRTNPERNWIVSYDEAPEILGLYRRLKSIRYTLDYSAASRRKASEVMFFSPALAVPSLEKYGYRAA